MVFLGDVLPECGRRYLVGGGVRRFLEDASYLVLNLEGPICDRRGVVNAVRHGPQILDFLANLFLPERTIILCANNHAADCGKDGLERTYQMLQECGFHVAGTKAETSILLREGIQLCNGTEWLNVRRPYVPRLTDADQAWSDSAKFRILCPHWGTEMTLFPSPRQIERARRLLERWDMIVGHHPHCPQPLAEELDKLVAYSLGNFARGDGGERGWHGAALRVTLGPDPAGQWRVGESHWTFVAQTPQPDGSLLIDTAESCRFFANDPIAAAV
jgi:poly-gamma-glutamate capsule biosynthesis protein CapA/YwtB (metallophosphatase superfamily)